MHIVCTICSDLVNPAESIYVTKCGHMFHLHCLSQWIERSKSCPQCRNKVTEKCIFRVYPTVSNEAAAEDAEILQSKLDNAQLELRQHKAITKEKDDKLTAITIDLKAKEEFIKVCENKLVSRDSAVMALKEQLEYLKVQNKETKRLKDENEHLKKNMQTMNGLQKVLNATTTEVEQMLEAYTDIKMVATFATALKRALCDSESSKKEVRDQLQITKQELSSTKNKVTAMQKKVVLLEENLQKAEEMYKAKSKRKAPETFNNTDDSLETVVKQFRGERRRSNLDEAVIVNDDGNISFNTMVKSIENADSPYLNLKQSNLALTALQNRPKAMVGVYTKFKPSELAILNAATKSQTDQKKTTDTAKNSNGFSIFHTKQAASFDLVLRGDSGQSTSNLDVSYDGLGGHGKLDTFPIPRANFKSSIPRLSARHKLKRPSTTYSQDIGKMLQGNKDRL